MCLPQWELLQLCVSCRDHELCWNISTYHDYYNDKRPRTFWHARYSPQLRLGGVTLNRRGNCSTDFIKVFSVKVFRGQSHTISHSSRSSVSDCFTQSEVFSLTLSHTL